MMKKYIITEKAKISPSPGSKISIKNIGITSGNVFVGGEKCIKGQVLFNFSCREWNGNVLPKGNGKITGTAKSVFINGKPVVTSIDSGNCSGLCTLTTSPFNTIPCKCRCFIKPSQSGKKVIIST